MINLKVGDEVRWAEVYSGYVSDIALNGFIEVTFQGGFKKTFEVENAFMHRTLVFLDDKKQMEVEVEIRRNNGEEIKEREKHNEHLFASEEEHPKFYPDLRIGELVRKYNICSLFQTSLEAGISISEETNTIVLIIYKLYEVYRDRWEKDILLFTASGLYGNQSMSSYLIRALYESINIGGKDLHVFGDAGNNLYIYLGRFKREGEPFREDQPDANGKMRKVFVFPLKFAKYQPCPGIVTTEGRIPPKELDIEKAKTLLGKRVKDEAFGIGKMHLIMVDKDTSEIESITVKYKNEKGELQQTYAFKKMLEDKNPKILLSIDLVGIEVIFTRDGTIGKVISQSRDHIEINKSGEITKRDFKISFKEGKLHAVDPEVQKDIMDFIKDI